MSVTLSNKAPKVIRHAGDLTKVIWRNKTFHKQNAIFIPNMGLIKCIDYGNHFIFRDTRELGSQLFCTCGSPAVALNYDAYKYGQSSNDGALLACMVHAGMVDGNPGRHADGSS